jgi:hypothetical protein
VKNAGGLILTGLLFVSLGCASHPPLGEAVEDAARRAALLQAYHRPNVRQAVFRTLICWPGREVSFTEVVKVAPDGGFSVAGITDIGSTLYAVQIAPDGQGRVLSKVLPFSDEWLLEGLVAELLLPWHGPDETCQLFVGRASPHDTLGERGRSPYILAREAGDETQVFTFDANGRWQDFRRFSGGHLRCRASLEWDGQSLPQRMEVDNRRSHYRTIRERVSVQLVPR